MEALGWVAVGGVLGLIALTIFRDVAGAIHRRRDAASKPVDPVDVDWDNEPVEPVVRSSRREP